MKNEKNSNVHCYHTNKQSLNQRILCIYFHCVKNCLSVVDANRTQATCSTLANQMCLATEIKVKSVQPSVVP